MSDYSSFKQGSVLYPLSTGSSSTLLQQADPVIYHLLCFFESVLNRLIGPRLMAEAASCGADQIQRAVAETLPLNPEPFLTEAHIQFPLLAAYRKSSKTKDIGQGSHSVDEVDVCYVLPPLQAGEAERLIPILKAAANVINNRTQQGMDPSFTPTGGDAGDHVWETAGVAIADFKGASFGYFEGANDLPFPSVVCHLELTEKSDYYYEELDDLAGENVTIDVAHDVEDTVDDFIEFNTYPGPTLTSVSPSTGSKAGGTTITLTGTDFRVSTPYTVTVGGLAATDVTVVSTTSITCVTPAHNAYDTFAADIVLTDQDDQSDTLEEAFTFTTP